MKKSFKEKAKVIFRKGKTTIGHMTAFNRKLPDFLIIGVQKGGTSSLYAMLCQHPQIARSVIKEIHYFDKNFNKGLKWYKGHFPTTFFHKNSLTGEASPYYIIHPLVPQRVAQQLPNVKIIVILRDPVDRAYSHYQMVKRNGFEPAGAFEEAINMESSRLDGELEKLSNDPSYTSPVFQRYSYLARGHYAEQLERWYHHFSKEQILILKSEDLSSNTEAVLSKVFEFLGLPEFQIKQQILFNTGQYLAMPPEIAEKLKYYFEPLNKRLENLTGIKFKKGR